MAWFVLYTKPQQEKKVVEGLEKLGIAVYCPMVLELKQWSDRVKKVETPLLKSYVFVNIEESQRNTVFQINGVVRYLFWLGKPAVIRAAEIETMQRWMEAKDAVVKVSSLQIGHKIILESGAFKGQEAVVKSVKNAKLELMLTSLGVKLTLESHTISGI
jgi:transcription antitermination factor NusG